MCHDHVMTTHLPISALPPVPWVRERDVDLLLAELLTTRAEFTTWLLEHDLRRRAEVPIGLPESVKAVINYSRPDAGPDGTGETDVIVYATYGSASEPLLISIENKVWATPQHNQGQRHRKFIESQQHRWGLAALIGPAKWITAYPVEADEFHLVIALEDVAQWCEGHGDDFRAAVFRQACVAPVFELAPDLQDWHTRVDRLFEEEFGIRLAPQRYERTKNQGQAKPNRWLACEQATLPAAPGAQQPWLMLRPASTNHPSRVVIEIPRAPASLVTQARASSSRSGLSVRVTKAGTLLIERHVAEASQWVVSAPFEEQVPSLMSMGHAILQLSAWWSELTLKTASM